MALGWRYILCASSDMEELGVLSAKGKGLTCDFNGSGSLGCSISMDDNVAEIVWPWRTCVAAQLDGKYIWSGPVVDRTTDAESGRMTISAQGWFEKLMHLLTKVKMNFTLEDAGVIIEALLEHANAQYAALGLGDSRITIGQVIPTQLRTISYELDVNIGQAIQDLATLEAGIDWRIDPQTRRLDILERRGEPKPECKWIYVKDGVSAYGNLKNVVQKVDGTVQCNEITPRGQIASGYASDEQSIIDHDVILSEAPSLSDVKDPDILNAYANAEMVYRSGPRVSYTMYPKTAVDSSASEDELAHVPRFGKDFDLGDTGFLTYRRGFIDIADQAERMFGVDLSIDDASGMETINTLTTSVG